MSEATYSKEEVGETNGVIKKIKKRRGVYMLWYCILLERLTKMQYQWTWDVVNTMRQEQYSIHTNKRTRKYENKIGCSTKNLTRNQNWLGKQWMRSQHQKLFTPWCSKPRKQALRRVMLWLKLVKLYNLGLEYTKVDTLYGMQKSLGWCLEAWFRLSVHSPH